jgi:plastocyanin
VALLFAANILVGSALAAVLRGRRSFLFLATFLVATIIAGGVAGAVVGEQPVHSLVAEGPEEPPTPPPASPTGTPTEGPTGTPTEKPTGPATEIEIAAQDIAFDTDQLTFAAGGPVTIIFDNRDANVPHNVSVYTSQGGETIFQEEPFPGPATEEYMFTAPAEPGTYYFQCDVHPNMNGTVTVE